MFISFSFSIGFFCRVCHLICDLKFLLNILIRRVDKVITFQFKKFFIDLVGWKK